MNRGRSRQVSMTAIARQASRERSSLVVAPVPIQALFLPPFMRSPSSSPPCSSTSMSPDHYDSPPSPPRSLEDQVHEAYALEDIHLAKILLLRLKGIEVTSDDDPRIAAVQDEDFDFCFMPNGPLLNEQDEKALKEMQQKEMERIEQLRRTERLRVCETKWIQDKQRLREQRLAEYQRRERRQLDTQERQRHDERRSVPLKSRKPVFSLDHLQRTRSVQDTNQQFVYDLMVVPGPSSYPPRTSHRRITPPPAPVRARHCMSAPIFDDSRSVPFRDVLQCMEGHLFPITPEDQEQERRRLSATPASASKSYCQPKHSRQQLGLLVALLEQVQYTDEERRNRKGKGKAKELSAQSRSLACMACSSSRRSPLPSPSLTNLDSSSSVSRTSSWLSFRSSSSSLSASTDLTTPSTSPSMSSWFGSRSKTWVSPTLSEPPTSMVSLRHSCRRGTSLTPIALRDGPLELDASPSHFVSPTSEVIPYNSRQCSPSTPSAQASAEGTGLLARRVSMFVEFAKGFQSAYVTTALFSVAVSHEPFHQESPKSISNSTMVLSGNTMTLRPTGSRASLKDVQSFLQREDPATSTLSEPKYIPLTCPFPPTSSPPRTVLPNPLPYQVHFKPLPKTPRSPYRCQAMADEAEGTDCCTVPLSTPSQMTWRIRFVANPAHLRLKALQNIIWQIGGTWEGCGRDTAMGGGKEKVVGVAYEGVGRSSLAVAVQ